MTHEQLPTWDECSKLADEKKDMSPVQRFIYEHEPTEPLSEEWRKQLLNIINFAEQGK